jgi:hypothetical protein
MERERDTTEQESLLDNDKQPWLSDIVIPPMMMHELHITLASFVSASRVHVSHMYIGFLLFSP